MSYNWLTSKFNVEWGFREGALERTFGVAVGSELYEGDLVVQAPGGASAGAVVKLGDTGAGEDLVGPAYNIHLPLKQMQDGSGAPGALVTPRSVWIVIEGNMTPSGIGSGGNKAVCLKSGYIVKTEQYVAGTYVPGDELSGNDGDFVVNPHVNAQIGATGVFVTTDRQGLGFLLEADAAAGTITVEVP